MNGEQPQDNGGAAAQTQPANGSAAYSGARARSEAKNQAARESLEPLAPGERPLAVTIASIFAAFMFFANLAALIFSDHDSVANKGGAIAQSVFICVILAAASIGMWKAKYWAVLGFQTILGFQIIFFALAVTRARSPLLVIAVLAYIALCSAMFWFLIRAMARLQMPESPDAKRAREHLEDPEEDNG